MKKYLVCSICFYFLFLYSVLSFARLGESMAESAKRYGSPVIEPSVHMTPLYKGISEKRYHHSGWCIRAAYAEDSTISIHYMKLARQNSKEALLYDDEIEAILQSESAGHRWKKVPRGTKRTKAEKYQKYFNSSIRLWINTNGSVAWMSTNFGIAVISREGLVFDANQVQKKERTRKASIPKF